MENLAERFGEEMMRNIHVAILEDHQGIIDGYTLRLSSVPEIKIVGQAFSGAALFELLRKEVADVLILDLHVPTSEENDEPMPVLHVVPELLKKYPMLAILVITMLEDAALIRALVEIGIQGYIVKDDRESIQQLGRIVSMVANGGVFFSQSAYRLLRRGSEAGQEQFLTLRQMEALSLCAAFPDSSTMELAKQMSISGSTFRNLLSEAYKRLGVQTRMGAILKARELGILTSNQEDKKNR
jgi:two-component system capsular synthesis response regulator RcsB